MHILRRSTRNTRRNATIISVNSLFSSCHMIPKGIHGLSENVVEVATQFYFNHYISTRMFAMVVT